MQPSPDGFVIEVHFSSDFADSVVVYQPQVEQLPVGFIVDVFHNQRLNLRVCILRARGFLWHLPTPQARRSFY